MRKKIALGLLSALLSLSMLTGCQGFGGQDDAVVATVGKHEITVGMANFLARYQQAQYETQFKSYLGEDMWSTEVSDGKTYEDNVKETVMTQLQQLMVLPDHQQEYQVEITKADEKKITAAAKQFVKDNDKADAAEVSGTQTNVETMLRLLTIQSRMEAAIGDKADKEVTDEEAAQKKMDYVLYPYTTTDESGKSTDLSDTEKAAQKEKAAALQTKVKAGQDLQALAATDGVEVKSVTFDKDSTTVDSALIAAADALGEGAVTEVVEADAGCYVAKVTSLLDREATDQQKETIIKQRQSDLYQKTAEEWVDKAGAKVKKSQWAKIDFNDLSVTMKQEQESQK